MTDKQITDIAPRALALNILIEVLENGAYSHLMLKNKLDECSWMDIKDRHLVTRLVEGTIEEKLFLDYVINLYSSRPVHKMKVIMRNVLRMSVYQILRMDHIPDSAACNEGVKLIERRGLKGIKGFANAILRTVVREKEAIPFPDRQTNPAGYLALCFSFPEWLVSDWITRFGEELTEYLLKAFFNKSPLNIRFNMSINPRDLIYKSLSEAGVKVHPLRYTEAGCALEEYGRLDKLEAFDKGWIQVQDESSMQAGLAADIKPGDVVIDVCAAPGGKTLHAADLLNHTGKVISCDISDKKIHLIEENVKRCGFSNVEVRVQDAREYCEPFDGLADVVLADLPCSGSGIIGRKPDIKYHITQDSIKSLVTLQREILSVITRYVKPGGTLIFSTCAISEAENEENRKFILEQFDFEPVSLEGRLSALFGKTAFTLPYDIKETIRDGYLQILPGVHDCDGFFVAAFKRLGEVAEQHEI